MKYLRFAILNIKLKYRNCIKKNKYNKIGRDVRQKFTVLSVPQVKKGLGQLL